MKLASDKSRYPNTRVKIAQQLSPIGSMYGIYTYIWLIFMVNVAKYTIHGYHGVSIQHMTVGLNPFNNLAQILRVVMVQLL